MTDRLSILYQDLLSGSYDCVDRIVLNAYFRMGHNPGGFCAWWRALTGSDDTLENAYLMRMAGRFSRRVRGYAKAHGIPVIDRPAGQRAAARDTLGGPHRSSGRCARRAARICLQGGAQRSAERLRRERPVPRGARQR